MKKFGKNDDQRKSPNISTSVPFCLSFSELTIGCLEIQVAFFVYRVAVTNGCPRSLECVQQSPYPVDLDGVSPQEVHTREA